MNTGIVFKLTTTILSLLLVACAADGSKRDEVVAFQPDPSQPFERCVSISRIARTDVLDHQNVIFYMRGGQIFRNWLPRRCAGLNNRDPFSYRTTISQLCNSDTITILDAAAFGSLQGASCGLGGFYPVTKPEVEALETEIKRIRELGIDF